MVRRIADRLGDFRQCRWLLGGFQDLHGLSDSLAVAPELVRLATETGAKTGHARLLARSEEYDMFALGPARRAARLAIDAGRLHRADHPPVPAPVAAHERRPGGIR